MSAPGPHRLSAALDHTAAIVGLIAAWAAYTHFGGVPAYLLPPPEAVGRVLWTSAVSGEIWGHLGFTVGNILMGFAAGSLLGVLLGFALGLSPRVEEWLEGPILILQTAPKIALAPLFVIWFGLGPASKIILIVSLVLFPVMVGALLGFRSVDPRYRDLAKIIGLGRWQRVLRIDLPAAMPDIFVGLRIGAVQAVVGAVLGEWMSGRLGLGAWMTYAAATYKTALSFAAVLVVVVLGILVHTGLAAVERRLLAWKA